MLVNRLFNIINIKILLFNINIQMQWLGLLRWCCNLEPGKDLTLLDTYMYDLQGY